ncbi:TrgA family protein [Octadecabacter sp. 1_MG-2023]|uniref:TrgA family protein n=1 Tax=unclassified Octadecabacter TaxID=196158 RepID=UPI001C0A4C34|nr:MULTISPECIES: TrgA family protein [unclassified Octadecabacter]MBU2993121.1 TrgA family protein [Octadecabacter sp. B2R22]MDO6733427.1 TrgA family protein [Octadecabacter sp. 1_MG-2023]
MPTMGRIVGAILYGALAWYTTILIVPLFPEGTNLGWFQEINTVFGFWVGWTIAGSRAGTGYTAAFSYGLTATIALVVSANFFNSILVMLDQSLRRRYDGPGEAVTAVFEMFVQHGAMIMTAQIITTLLIGGIGAAMIVEFFGKRFT